MQQKQALVGSDGADWANWLAAQAKTLGLARAAIVPANGLRPQAATAMAAWLAAGHHGTMDYLASPEHRAAKADPRRILPNAQSAIVVALAYDPALATDSTDDDDARVRGQIARYARGDDYHMVLRDRLVALADALRATLALPVNVRTCVDSAPVAERDLAARAGLAFLGKNAMAIAPGLGSFFVLGALLVDVELPTTAPPEMSGRCGECRACLDACPTQAFVDAHILDARRCISYQTIENEGSIPRELRRAVGNWIFGCDICQTSCPFNQGKGQPALVQLAARSSAHAQPDLAELAFAPANQLRHFVKRTAMRRSGRAQLLRNVAVALGNSRQAAALAPLAHLLGHAKPLVREHAAWALGELARDAPLRPAAHAALATALAQESDEVVRSEINAALSAT